MLTSLTVDAFLEELASDSPAPGGGSVAAVLGSMSAGLVCMVCRLTIGKKGYEKAESLMSETLVKADVIKGSLIALIDEDSEAFKQVMMAFKMPKDTPSEKEDRSNAIQAGFKNATEIPLTVAQNCLDLLEWIQVIVDKANSNTISDLGVAAQTAYAGVEGAIMNVRINLPSIKDLAWAEEKKSMLSKLLTRATELNGQIGKKVNQLLG